jgi:hypothetical protein
LLRALLVTVPLDLLPVFPSALALEFEEVAPEPRGPGVTHQVSGELGETRAGLDPLEDVLKLCSLKTIPSSEGKSGSVSFR